MIFIVCNCLQLRQEIPTRNIFGVLQNCLWFVIDMLCSHYVKQFFWSQLGAKKGFFSNNWSWKLVVKKDFRVVINYWMGCSEKNNFPVLESIRNWQKIIFFIMVPKLLLIFRNDKHLDCEIKKMDIFCAWKNAKPSRKEIYC